MAAKKGLLHVRALVYCIAQLVRTLPVTGSYLYVRTKQISLLPATSPVRTLKFVTSRLLRANFLLKNTST